MPPITITAIPYKYRLHELFIKHFGKSAAEAKQTFAEVMKCSLETVKQDCRRAIDDIQPIPADRLQQYAHLFGCNITELKNQKAACATTCQH